MASRKLFHVTVISFSFFVLCVAQSKLSDGFYNCFIQQACNCGQHSRWKDCWDEYPEGMEHLFIDEINKCEYGDPLKYNSYQDFADMFCNVPEDIRKPCYNKAKVIVKERVKETILGLHGLQEAIAVEKTRLCLDPIMAFCTNDPTGCLSEG